MTTTVADIVAALNELDGINATPELPLVFDEGAAWPQISGYDNSDHTLPPGTFMLLWEVYVITAGEDAAAREFLTSRSMDLAGALMDLMFVDRIEPVVLETNEGDRKAVLISGRSE